MHFWSLEFQTSEIFIRLKERKELNLKNTSAAAPESERHRVWIQHEQKPALCVTLGEHQPEAEGVKLQLL